jgi:hypothetical protein
LGAILGYTGFDGASPYQPVQEVTPLRRVL